MPDNTTPDRYLKLKRVLEVTDLSRPTIYREIKAGRFPKPVKIGTASRWSANEIADYIERLKAAR